ncbi:hypothetical protein [Sphingobacterium sp. IITKGP-BTPF85]|uniref:hypothetical protein n=1 Tax=Sphingobacterium sp. IITKGP-BTPF85 TaxID=1338009 RepID=UPI00038A255F|nr:hypothetical protein [Sphingobacterium sp. IITKGP-BTPF85]
MQSEIKAINEDHLQIEVKDKEGHIEQYELDLKGTYQSKNILGVLRIVDHMRTRGYDLLQDDVKMVCEKYSLLPAFKVDGRHFPKNLLSFAILDIMRMELGKF